jgi:hypothetical protein
VDLVAFLNASRCILKIWTVLVFSTPLGTVISKVVWRTPLLPLVQYSKGNCVGWPKGKRLNITKPESWPMAKLP